MNFGEHYTSRLYKAIFEDYFYHRFTLNELSKKYHHSRQWIQEKIHHYQPKIKKPIPREVVLVIDATFFGKRVDKFGLIVAKDVLKLDIVSYHFITTESIYEYQIILEQLKQDGFTVSTHSIWPPHAL